MLFSFKFLLEFIFKSIYKNILRSSTIVVTTILVLSSTIAMLAWIEVSPDLVVEKTFSSHGYELQVSQIFHNPTAFSTLQWYLETEPLVESVAVIHKSMFLYNLNYQSPSFNVLNPPDPFNFYITTDFTRFDDGVYFVPPDYIKNIESLLQFEPGSQITFNDDNSGIIISRRMLNLLEETCEHDYQVGDPIEFSVSRDYLPEGFTNLGSLYPLAFENMRITAIYDRIPTGLNQLEYTFYQETLGDGLFVSHELLNASDVELMESNGFFPRLFVRTDRQKAAQLGSLTEIVPEIEHLGSRIAQQGFFRVFTQNEEVNSLLHYYDYSRFVISLLLLPLVILSEVLFLVLVKRLADDETFQKLQYLRLRGTTDRQILFVEFGQFLILTLLGIIGGIVSGLIFIDVLLSTSGFLDFSKLIPSIGSGIQLILNSGAFMTIIGVISLILINFAYFSFRFITLLMNLQRLEGVKPSSRMFSRRTLGKKSLFFLIGVLALFAIFPLVSPVIIKELGVLGISLQLVPLVLVIVMGLWLLISFFSPQYLLQFLESLLGSLNIFKNPQRKLTWLSLFRRKSQYLSLMALLALTVSLTGFSLIYFQSLHENSVKNADYLIGADLKVLLDPEMNMNLFKRQVEQIEGVESCIGFLQYQILTPAKYAFLLVGINPDTYYNICPIEETSIAFGPPPKELWSIISNYSRFNSVIVSSRITEIFQWEIGSTIETFGFTGHNTAYDLTIRAIIDSAPGIGPLYLSDQKVGTFDFGGYAIVHEDLLFNYDIAEASTFLVKLQSNSGSVNSIIDQIRQLDPAVRGVFTASYVLQSNQNFLQLAGVQGILTLNCLGAIFICLIGISTFYQCLLDERLTEFAMFLSLGATQRKIMKLVFKESGVLSIISLSIGVITGVLFGVGFLITSRGVTVSPYNAFRLDLVVPPFLLFLAVVLILGFVLIVNLTRLRKISTFEIASILRGE